MMSKRCIGCGKEIPYDALMCPYCGRKFVVTNVHDHSFTYDDPTMNEKATSKKKPEVYSCPRCGKDVPFGAKVCPFCQLTIEWQDEAGDEIEFDAKGNVKNSNKKICNYCGMEIPATAVVCPYCRSNLNNAKRTFKNINDADEIYTARWVSIWKLVSGIITILLFFIMSFQSCAISCMGTIASYSDASYAEYGVSGFVGIIASMIMLAGAIVSIVIRNKKQWGTDLVLIILFSLSSLFCMAFSYSFSDLFVYGIWCVVCTIIPIISFMISWVNSGKQPKNVFIVVIIFGCILVISLLVGFIFGPPGQIRSIKNLSSDTVNEVMSDAASSLENDASVTDPFENAISNNGDMNSDMDEDVTLGEQNALESAYSYLDYTGFSYSGLISQLEFKGYTNDEAKYAADNCGADWNEQAAKCAEDYLSFTSFSRNELIDQLKYEGFTEEQAEYGASVVGY